MFENYARNLPMGTEIWQEAIFVRCFEVIDISISVQIILKYMGLI